MKILVLGAGVVGTAAAYYLARDGHEVTVVERHDAVAMGTSRSNAGFISPGDATAWASPAALKTFIASLFNPDFGIKVRFSLDPMYLAWIMRFLGQCTSARAAVNSENKLRLAFHSLSCINQITADTGIGYDERRNGILYMYRSQAGLDAGARHMRFLADRGLAIEVIDRRRIAELEPKLDTGAIAGAVYSPMDQTGDSQLFTARLAAWCSGKLGVEFAFNTTVTGLDTDAGRVRAVLTSKGPMACGAVVVSLGPESGLFGRLTGIDLPVYPVKGYTATITLDDSMKGPTRGGVDCERYVAYSRLGDRLRLASSAEFAGFDRGHVPGDFRNLFATAKQFFSGSFDPAKAELWAGLRPMMPNSVPLHGRARYDNLYLDTGHGHLGWTLAAGSGQLLSDLVAGRKTAIDPAGLVYKTP